MTRMNSIVSRLLLPLTICLICSCGGDNDQNRSSSATAVVFSDIHFNPFYDPSIFQDLLAADVHEWAGIFEKSAIAEPSAYGADTNFPLLVLALSGMRRQVGDSPLVIFNGDLLGHNIAKTFFELYGSQDIAAMHAFTDKTVVFLMQMIRRSIGDIPVLFAVGNADSYSGIEPEPDFLSNTAEFYYSQFLNGTADHEAFLESFKAGGYYSARPYGAGLTVIGLNTMLFYPIALPEAESRATVELSWLDSTLASAKANGEKVWLLMHVPPGADIGSTAQLVDNSGHIGRTVMMWRPDYQARFLQILSQYPGIISFSLAAHTHMDEYRIMADNVLHGSPSISPVFGNNPAFKIFNFSNTTFEPADYISLNYNLAAMPEEFQDFYTFSSAYSLEGPLDASLDQLYPMLATDGAKQSLYREYYYSGITPANPITDRNWPVYWCGIANMNQQELIDCVNAYRRQL